jgi:hypothetical protein
VSDREAHDIVFSVIDDLSEAEKTRQAEEKEEALIAKVKSDRKALLEDYERAVQLQPDLLNVDLDPAYAVSSCCCTS